MAKLSKSEKMEFKQKDRHTSLTAGYEWILNYLKIKTPLNFQKKYLCIEDYFEGTAEKIARDYKNIKINWKSFENAKKKIKFLQEKIDDNIPCLMSMYIGRDRWHIFPVVGYDCKAKKLHLIDPSNREMKLDYDYIEKMHENTKTSRRFEVSWMELGD